MAVVENPLIVLNLEMDNNHLALRRTTTLVVIMEEMTVRIVMNMEDLIMMNMEMEVLLMMNMEVFRMMILIGLQDNVVQMVGVLKEEKV